MSSIVDNIIALRNLHDPWWNRRLSRDETYPSKPPRIPLDGVPRIQDFRMSNLPSRYHWFIWIEHSGERMYYAYENVDDDILSGLDTTIEDLIDADEDGYSPMDRQPLVEDIPGDFIEFLSDSFETLGSTYHPPFMAKYGFPHPEDPEGNELPVAQRFIERGLSLVQDPENMEQDAYHIFCILHDLGDLL